MVCSTFMWCWRSLIFSLRFSLLLAFLVLGTSFVNASGNDLNPPISLTATFNAESLEILPTGVSFDVFTSIDLVGNQQQPGVTQPQQKPSPNPAIFSDYWPQFVFSFLAFERQAASVFNAPSQLEPLFVIAFEFLPEIRARKYFLALLCPAHNLPWYLRVDSSNQHNRLAGWKDGNTLYSGNISYLS